MGSACQNCPSDQVGRELAPGHGQFPEHIQSVIDLVRSYHKQQFNSLKDHKLPNGKFYRGNLVSGRKNGYGELFANNNAYFGVFQNDVPNGDGLLIKDYRDYIKGTFQNGKPNGQVKQKINRNEFHGHYSNGQKVKGILTTDSYTYEGGFKNNKFNGYGILQFKNGDRYEGDFKDGLYDGDGKYETVSQGTYQGQFKNGYFDGKGIFKWQDDYYYEGNYKKGVRNGFGKFVKGNNEYEGYWVDGQPQNNSKFINQDQFDEQLVNSRRLHGSVKLY